MRGTAQYCRHAPLPDKTSPTFWKAAGRQTSQIAIYSNSVRIISLAYHHCRVWGGRGRVIEKTSIPKYVVVIVDMSILMRGIRVGIGFQLER